MLRSIFADKPGAGVVVEREGAGGDSRACPYAASSLLTTFTALLLPDVASKKQLQPR
jgi:hypothetical protein